LGLSSDILVSKVLLSHETRTATERERNDAAEASFLASPAASAAGAAGAWASEAIDEKAAAINEALAEAIYDEAAYDEAAYDEAIYDEDIYDEAAMVRYDNAPEEEEIDDYDDDDDAMAMAIIVGAAGTDEENAAAVTLQSAQRAKFARRRVEGIRAENHAAVKIQSRQRAKAAKKRVDGIRAERAAAVAAVTTTAVATTSAQVAVGYSTGKQLASSSAARGRDPLVRAMFAELDRSGDGVVNIREMIIALRNSPQLAARLTLPSRIRQGGAVQVKSS
jgi:hypothetical protein